MTSFSRNAALKLTLAGGLAVSALALSQSVSAHHSNAPHFDADIELRLTGTVTDWKMINPHAYIYFDVTKDDGTIENWRCETDAASALRRRGFSDATFETGETVTIIGNPARREPFHCFYRDFVFADGTEVGRNTDVSSLARGESIDTLRATSVPKAVLQGNEPDISGYWMDNESGQARQALAAFNRASMAGGNAQAGGANMAPGAGPAMAMGGGTLAPGQLPNRFASINLSEDAQKLFEGYERIYDDPSLECRIGNILDGMGRDTTVTAIEQKGDIIEINYGYMDYKRTIYLGQDNHPENITLTDGGYSIGRWEDDELVVDTIGFLPGILSAPIGIPVSEEMRVVERFSLDEDGVLTRRSKVTDGKYWGGSYEEQDTWVMTPEAITPYNCEELSGLNNLRPGTPEHAAELARVNAMGSLPATGSDTQADAKTGGSKTMIWIALVGLAVLLGGLFFMRGRKS